MILSQPFQDALHHNFLCWYLPRQSVFITPPGTIDHSLGEGCKVHCKRRAEQNKSRYHEFLLITTNDLLSLETRKFIYFY